MSYPPGNQSFYGSYTPAQSQPVPVPRYLGMAVAALGALTYLISYGPVLGGSGIGWSVRFAVLAGLAAGFGLLPQQTPNGSLIASLSALGFLDALSAVITTSGDHRGWAAIVIVVLNGLQALAAIGLLLGAADADAAQASRSSYQAYADYYAQYYGQYGQQQQPPADSLAESGAAHAQQTSQAAASRPDTGAGGANYADYVGYYEQGPAPTRAAPSNQVSGLAAPQMGLPSVGQAPGPAQQHEGRPGAERRQTSQ